MDERINKKIVTELILGEEGFINYKRVPFIPLCDHVALGFM